MPAESKYEAVADRPAAATGPVRPVAEPVDEPPEETRSLPRIARGASDRRKRGLARRKNRGHKYVDELVGAYIPLLVAFW